MLPRGKQAERGVVGRTGFGEHRGEAEPSRQRLRISSAAGHPGGEGVGFQLALAQALYRQGNFQESADLYAKLMQDSPPTLMLLRGLGVRPEHVRTPAA